MESTNGLSAINHVQWPTKAINYKLHTPIGQGSFGLVWKAECITGGHMNTNVAIKIIDLE